MRADPAGKIDSVIVDFLTDFISEMARKDLLVSFEFNQFTPNFIHLHLLLIHPHSDLLPSREGWKREIK